MNTRMPDADGTHRLGGIDGPGQPASRADGKAVLGLSPAYGGAMTGRPAAETFAWPCDKRKAHGAHYRQSGGDQPPGDLAIYLARKDPRVCPGVKAHPKTMIGGRLL